MSSMNTNKSALHKDVEPVTACSHHHHPSSSTPSSQMDLLLAPSTPSEEEEVGEKGEECGLERRGRGNGKVALCWGKSVQKRKILADLASPCHGKEARGQQGCEHLDHKAQSGRVLEWDGGAGGVRGAIG